MTTDTVLMLTVQMIDSHIASVGRHGYNIVWHLGTYTLKLATNIFLQVLAMYHLLCNVC